MSGTVRICDFLVLKRVAATHFFARRFVSQREKMITNLRATPLSLCTNSLASLHATFSFSRAEKRYLSSPLAFAVRWKFARDSRLLRFTPKCAQARLDAIHLCTRSAHGRSQDIDSAEKCAISIIGATAKILL
jgi:hypothetical protein